MDLTIDGATKLSSCSIDLINADLARTACFEEVHDARITLQRSGSEDVIFKATSSSSFTTPISPEITIAHEATARNLPAFCRQRSADTIICTPAFFAPNQPYQFSIRFDNSVSNEISAEIAEAATFDPKLDNNIARIVIPANSNSVVTAICVDHDGDGYGWNGTGTCIPVNIVEPPVTTPSIVDRRTGSAIDLNNDIWVLSDLANRTIECRSYYFSSGQNQYLVDDTIVVMAVVFKSRVMFAAVINNLQRLPFAQLTGLLRKVNTRGQHPSHEVHGFNWSVSVAGRIMRFEVMQVTVRSTCAPLSRIPVTDSHRVVRWKMPQELVPVWTRHHSTMAGVGMGYVPAEYLRSLSCKRKTRQLLPVQL